MPDKAAGAERPGLKLRITQWARLLKRDILALYFAARHPLTPWYAKALAAIVVGYAFSPIDLIPDFVPVLGYLDDLVLVPLGIALVVKLLPPAVLSACREEAELRPPSVRPKTWLAAGLIIALWFLALYGLCRIIF
jgi:uncharacterized membrane protein YkvA (DUF1232 family)